MTRLAALLMFLSWLPLCAMPAMASVRPQPVKTGHHQLHAVEHPPGHSHHALPDQEKVADDRTEPGHHGGKGCLAGSCPVCLTLLPQAPQAQPAVAGLSHLSDHSSRPLLADAPAPPEPPPRG
jgi:hypothetical protein